MQKSQKNFFIRTLVKSTLILSVLVWSACSTLQNSAPQAELVHINPPAQDNPSGDAAYRLLVAEIALNQGQTELAIENYLILANSHANPDIAEKAVRVAIYGKNLEAALEAAQRWVELAPDRIEARQILAVIYIRQNLVDQAFDYLNQMIQTGEVEDKRLFISLLGALAREKNMSAAVQVTRKIAQRYPERAYAQYLHGMLSAQSGRSEEALQFINQSLTIENIEGALSARAKLLLKLGQRDQAVVSLEKAVANQPDDHGLRLTYARLLVDVKQYEKARIEFEKLNQAKPNDVDLLYTLGLLSLEAGHFDDAEKYMLKLVSMDQRDGGSQYYLGRVNESRENYGEAIKWYRQVYIGEYVFDAKLRVAAMLVKSGHQQEAHAHLDAMLEASGSEDASLVRIYLTKGELWLFEEKFQSAAEVYNTGLAIFPGNTELLYARALVSEKLNRIDLLEQDIRTILKTEPDNAHALNALGFTLADRTDRYQEAYGLLERAIGILPDDAAIIDSFGWVHYRLGEYEKAIRLLRMALSRYDNSEIAAHLGEVLWVTGKQSEARQVWQDALQKKPGDKILEKVIRRFTQ